MSFRKIRSVNQKMTAIIFVVSMFVMVLTTALFVAVEIKRTHDVTREDLHSLAKLVSANVSFLLTLKDYAGAEKVLDSLAARKEVASSYLLLPNGKAVASYSHLESRNARINPVEDTELLKVEARQIAQGLRQGTQHTWLENGRLAYFMPIEYEGSHIGYHYLSVNLADMRAQQLYLALGWLLVMGPAILVTYLLSARLQRHISTPIEQLASRMEQISREKRLVGFVPQATEDEFNLLFHGFDEMIRALKERDRLLEEQRMGLEMEVQVRTRALEAEKERAEQATIAKSRFLANMSHEIRTPMIGVLGMAELLRQKDFKEEDRAMVETIHRSGEALLAILNDVLDFSKIEAGRLELETTTVDLARLAQDVLNLMAPSAHAKGVDIQLDAPDNLPEVVGDAGRIRQVLLNLVGNAVKFTDAGTIFIAVSVVRRVADPLCECVLQVRDTGVGIAEESLSRIFESFDQGDSGMARKFQGTGLGLSITRELVHLMCGKITVESSLGGGSTFAVRLPLPLANPSTEPCLERVQPMQRPASASMIQPLASGRPRILLVEDNPTTQNLISILLEQMGLDLLVVDNGQAAIDLLDKENVDLIFMDCQMPQMDGFEATAILRSRGLSTPIIALTAYALAEDEQHCLAAGMDDFLSKPFRQAALRGIISRWLAFDDGSRTAIADSAC